MVLQHLLMLQLWSDGPTASADGPAVIRWVSQHPLMVQLWSDGPTASANASTVIRWSHSICWWSNHDQMVLQHPLMVQLWSDGPTACADGPAGPSVCLSWLVALSSSLVHRLRCSPSLVALSSSLVHRFTLTGGSLFFPCPQVQTPTVRNGRWPAHNA